MGMFDSVMVRCPECGTINEFQSKGGACVLAQYTLSNAPPEVLADVNRHPVNCEGCGTPYHVALSVIPRVERGHAERLREGW